MLSIEPGAIQELNKWVTMMIVEKEWELQRIGRRHQGLIFSPNERTPSLLWRWVADPKFLSLAFDNRRLTSRILHF